jgi:hypothetical protein
MRGFNRESWSAFRSAGLVPVACALLLVIVGASPPAQAQPCTVEGAWISEADVGAVFFKVANRGANANSGTLFIEWVVMDPTLFGNFPDAVTLTQGVGVWQHHLNEDVAGNRETHYTWMAYGLGSDGLPVYVVVKVSGADTLQSCNTIAFDYVMEIFLASQDPFVDPPIACIEGTGVKHRIPVTAASCD